MTAYCSHFKFDNLNQKKLIRLDTIFIFYTSEILECFWLDNIISDIPTFKMNVTLKIHLLISDMKNSGLPFWIWTIWIIKEISNTSSHFQIYLYLKCTTHYLKLYETTIPNWSVVMSVPCTFNFFESFSPADLKALNPIENNSKAWKSFSKYISEQLTRTFAVLVYHSCKWEKKNRFASQAGTKVLLSS